MLEIDEYVKWDNYVACDVHEMESYNFVRGMYHRNTMCACATCAGASV